MFLYIFFQNTKMESKYNVSINNLVSTLELKKRSKDKKMLSYILLSHSFASQKEQEPKGHMT